MCTPGGGDIYLYRAASSSAGNLGHELTHAGLYDHSFAPRSGFLPPIIWELRDVHKDGALPFGAHQVLGAYWNSFFP
jgi:hypothetical protein